MRCTLMRENGMDKVHLIATNLSLLTRVNFNWSRLIKIGTPIVFTGVSQ